MSQNQKSIYHEVRSLYLLARCSGDTLNFLGLRLIDKVIEHELDATGSEGGGNSSPDFVGICRVEKELVTVNNGD